MGKVAEAMLGETLCSRCGGGLGSDDEIPTLCAACARADAAELNPRGGAIRPVPEYAIPEYAIDCCPYCGETKGTKDATCYSCR